LYIFQVCGRPQPVFRTGITSVVSGLDRYVKSIVYSEEGHVKGFRSSPEFKPFFEAVKPFFNGIQARVDYFHSQV
jgi:hypothetical protein